MAVTTTPHGAPDLRVPIAPTVEDGLWHTCFAMVDWPQTIRAEHLGAMVGRLGPVTLEAVTGRVAVVLGIGEARGTMAS